MTEEEKKGDDGGGRKGSNLLPFFYLVHYDVLPTLIAS